MNFSLLKKMMIPALVSGLMAACGGINNEDDAVQMENKKTTKKSGNESFKNNRKRNLRLSSDQKAKEAKKSTSESGSGTENPPPEQISQKELREYAIDICTERAAEILHDSLSPKDPKAPVETEEPELAYEKSLNSAYTLVDTLTLTKAVFDKLDAAYTNAIDNMKGTDKKSVSQCVEIIVKAELEAEKELTATQSSNIDKQWEKHEVVLNEIFDAIDKVHEECEFFLVDEFDEEDLAEDLEVEMEDIDFENFEEFVYEEEILDDQEFDELMNERKELADSKECKDATAALDAVVKKHSSVKP